MIKLPERIWLVLERICRDQKWVEKGGSTEFDYIVRFERGRSIRLYNLNILSDIAISLQIQKDKFGNILHSWLTDS